MELLEGTRAAVAWSMLLGALVLDLRSRRVRNRYWFPFLGAAAALWAVDLGMHGWEPLWVPAAVALGQCVLFYALFYTGLYGGADAKGLMTMALLVPEVPMATLRSASELLPLPAALGALMAGAAFTLAYPILLFATNALRGRFRLPAMLLGLEMDLARARRRHVWPMQRIEDGQVRWKYTRYIGGDFEATYDALATAGLTRVWATPKIPFLGFAFAGYTWSLLWGNPLVALMGLATGR